MKKTNASAVARLLNKNGINDAHAANNGEVVVVKFEGPHSGSTERRRSCATRAPRSSRCETDTPKVLGNPSQLAGRA